MAKLSNYFSFIRDLKLLVFKIKWKKINSNNQTTPGTVFDSKLVKIGNYTYGKLNVYSFDDDKKLRIGNFCCIGPEVKFLLSGEHDYKKVSSYNFKQRFLNENESISKGDIVIEDDVWLGFGSTILSGVTIGQGAVIGAGSIVASDIPPYAIYAGGKIIKYRFDKKIIELLEKIDYSKIDEKFVKENIESFYGKCNEEKIQQILKYKSK